MRRRVCPVGAVSKTIRVESRILAANQRAHAIEQRDLLRARCRGGEVDLPVRFLQDRVAEQWPMCSFTSAT